MAERAKARPTGPDPSDPPDRQTDEDELEEDEEEENMPQSLFDWMSYGHHVARPPPPSPPCYYNCIINRIKDPRSEGCDIE